MFFYFRCVPQTQTAIRSHGFQKDLQKKKFCSFIEMFFEKIYCFLSIKIFSATRPRFQETFKDNRTLLSETYGLVTNVSQNLRYHMKFWHTCNDYIRTFAIFTQKNQKIKINAFWLAALSPVARRFRKYRQKILEAKFHITGNEVFTLIGQESFHTV